MATSLKLVQCQLLTRCCSRTISFRWKSFSYCCCPWNSFRHRLISLLGTKRYIIDFGFNIKAQLFGQRFQSVIAVKFGLNLGANLVDTGVCLFLWLQVYCLEVFYEVFDGLDEERLKGWSIRKKVLCSWESWDVNAFILVCLDKRYERFWGEKVVILAKSDLKNIDVF